MPPRPQGLRLASVTLACFVSVCIMSTPLTLPSPTSHNSLRQKPDSSLAQTKKVLLAKWVSFYVVRQRLKQFLVLDLRGQIKVSISELSILYACCVHVQIYPDLLYA